MTGKLLGDKIMVKIEDPKEVKRGGIIIPDTAKEKPQEGVVVLVGPGRRTDNGTVLHMEIKVGDNVLFEKYAGKEVKIDEQVYMIVGADDVMMIR